MSTSSRRTFLAASTAFSLGRVLGANDKVNVGIVGIGGRGNDHIKSYATLPDARIVHACQPGGARNRPGEASSGTGNTPRRATTTCSSSRIKTWTRVSSAL